jgi:squalene-associated FAD-dependent desaturase
MSRVHVIGAGLAGLSASVRLVQAGREVHLYEAAPRAGGRCRSYFEPKLDCTIDNGGHVILGANAATLAYVETIGSSGELLEIAPARFPFIDLTTGDGWTLRPNAGPLPWWLLAPSRRVPGTTIGDYVGLARLLAAGADATVADRVPTGSGLYRTLIEPLAIAIMNAPPGEAAALPLATVLRATLMRGERSSRPMIARRGLSFALIDPALDWLKRHGASYRSNARLDHLCFAEDRVAGLRVAGADIAVAPDDVVVLAVPPRAAGTLIAGLCAPSEHAAIVNAHFRLPQAVAADAPLLGLIGGSAHWLILRDDVVSVTVSAADAIIDDAPEQLLERLWADTAKALKLTGLQPPGRLIKEKRATFRQTPAAEACRPGAPTPYRNLFLAGDWTATGLPATIEGAIRSGLRAADAAETGPRSP